MLRCGTKQSFADKRRSQLELGNEGTWSSRRASTPISCCSCSSPSSDRRWLRFHLFEAKNPSAFQDANLRGRYLETTELAASYTYFLDTLNGLRRVEEIRSFRALEYGAKKQRILALMDAPPAARAE